jgi:hypothetical protein
MGKPNEIRPYTVPIVGEIEASLIGHVQVYATSETEAIAKVQAQIAAETLDEDIEMEDVNSGYTMPYGKMHEWCSEAVEIDESGIEENTLDEADLGDVLREDVRQLQALVSWDAEALTKHKAFLEKLAETQVSAA